ncbi:MAG TPA: FGGY-family carbohydrate kinase, partial [Thermomicrobiales bacterium]|nr:FGGY-family carbohydrate kinase [Thermomicrobiales bacterium]
MSGSLLLGIDIGSYSSKGVLVTPDGEVVLSATVEHEISFPRPGWAEHDADTIWWGNVVQITRELLSGRYSGDDIAAVGISAIGSCMLPVDRNGQALRPGILYGIDTRATAEIDLLNEQFGADAMFELGGMGLTSQAIGPKILWFRRNEPELFARTHKIITASSYPVLKLTGEFVMDRHSASYYNPLIDINTLEWDSRFAGPIVDMEQLPRLLWSDEIAGTVTPSAAAETGLRVGTPVTAGTIDAAAEALSVGIIDPGDLMLMYGTTMFFIQATAAPTPDPRMWCCGYCFPGRYGIEGGMSTTGALLRWFRDQFAQPELAIERAGGANAYAALAELAATSAPGSRGLICLPYFSGERTPINDPLARGTFVGLTLSHTRADLYRSVLEGTGYGVADNLAVMASMGADPTRIVAVGGGTLNPLWLQIVSDITGKIQQVPA